MSSIQACAQSQTTICGEVSSEDWTQELGKRAVWNSALLWIIDIPYPLSPGYQKWKHMPHNYISLVPCSWSFWFKKSLLFQIFQIPRWRIDPFPSVLFPFRQPASQKGDATRLRFPIPRMDVNIPSSPYNKIPLKMDQLWISPCCKEANGFSWNLHWPTVDGSWGLVNSLLNSFDNSGWWRAMAQLNFYAVIWIICSSDFGKPFEN